MPSPLIIDPEIFSEHAIADDTAAAVASLETMLTKAPSLCDLPIDVVRNALRGGVGPLAMETEDPGATWRTVEAGGVSVRLREFAVDAPRGVYLHMHQGGFCFGAADFQDQTLRKLANDLGVTVLSVDYRLAPENPWPAPPDDCEAAARWLVANAAMEFGTDKIIIGGESAGAYYAVISMLRLRDRDGFTGWAGANLSYGPYDMSMGPALRNWGVRDLILNTRVCAYFGELLLPPDRWSLEDRRAPEISPLFAQLHDMPPALFTIGTLDPMIDDTMFMAARWIAAGGEADLAIYPGGVHLFDRLPIGIARDAKARMRDFMSARLSSL
ncbi:MAG: alpha/beta hydrolase [Parvularculaceae bacterium]